MLIFFSPSAAIHFLKRDVTDYSAGFFPVTKQKDVCNSPAQYLTSVNKCLSSKPLWQMELSSAVTIPFTYLSKAGAFTFHYFSRNVSLKKKKVILMLTKTHMQEVSVEIDSSSPTTAC